MKPKSKLSQLQKRSTKGYFSAKYGSHIGEFIRDMFFSLLKQWDIDAKRVVLVLQDSGANMVKGMRLAKVPNLS